VHRAILFDLQLIANEFPAFAIVVDLSAIAKAGGNAARRTSKPSAKDRMRLEDDCRCT
jgi:hypothetical protein